MPSIAEVIAAKKAAARKAAASEPPVDHELDGLIDRLKPVGKPKAAALVLSSKDPLPPAEVAMKAAYAERRSLSRTEGEAIPLVPVNADKETATWHEAMNSFESSLCVMRDPVEPAVVWLAIRPDREGLPPILLHRLPLLLWDHPASTYRETPF